MLSRISFILSVFLYEVSDLLFLFALPLFLFSSTKSLLIVGLIMLLRVLGRYLAFSIYKSKLQQKNFVFIILIAYALSFIVLILFNRYLSTVTLIISVLVFGLSREFINIGILKVESDNTKFDLRKYKKYLNPSLIFACIVIPLFVTKPLYNYQFQNLLTFYSILLSLSALLFYFFISKKYITSKENIIFPKVYSLKLNNIIKINWILFIINSIKTLYWVILPFYIITNLDLYPNVIYIIPSIYLPILILTILKNSSLFKYWKVKSSILLFLLSIFLLGFFLSNNVSEIIIPSISIGIVIGLIQASNWYKEENYTNYTKFTNSTSIAYLITVILSSLLTLYLPIQYIFGTLGLILLLILIFIRFKLKINF